MPRLSWGGYPAATHRGIVPLRWRTAPAAWALLDAPVLPHGCGRSYGDSCLNDGGWLLDTRGLDRFISFDRESGVIRCEAGATLADVLALTVPAGWFLPVVPGTRFVTVGGAIANDIHGKNHHVDGTFGRHVRSLELLRSTGERLRCAPDEQPELFRATVGGLGLTGLVLSAEIGLMRVPGACVRAERIRFGSLSEFLELSNGEEHRYTVAWADALAGGRALGRGVFIRGDHAAGPCGSGQAAGLLRVPFDSPVGVLTGPFARAFNTGYFHLRRSRTATVERYEPFFFPLDGVPGWNRLYGPAGFLQYQCVVPAGDRDALTALLRQVSGSGEASFLTVLKRFGDVPSPGLLSFPRPGVTATFDFRYRGSATLSLLDRLDDIVGAAGGAVYPAKDARMSAASFRRYFPAWERFTESVDPAFSSSFWRRVTTGAA